VKGFRAQVEPVVDLAPQRRTKEAVVLVASSRVYPIATAAIGRPGTEILLQQNRQVDLCMSGAEVEFLISNRHQDLRVDGHLRKPVVLARRDEPVFCAELDILQGKASVAAIGHDIALRNDRSELEVRQSPVVHLQTRQDAVPTISGSGSQREQVRLEMLELDRFGIIGAERGTSEDRLRQQHDNRQGSCPA
jgi:hypothetical protein